MRCMNRMPKVRLVCFGMFIFLLGSLTWGALAPKKARAGQPDGNPLYQKGVFHYRQGEYKHAFVLFYELFKEMPENPEVNFYLGRSAFETGDYETALFAFERILIAEPESQRAKLEMARSHWKMGSLAEASRLFKEVLESDPPEKVKANIERYLTAIETSRKRHFVNLSVTTGINFDDNLNLSPVDETLNLPGLDLPWIVRGEESGHYVPLSLVFQHRYLFDGFPGYWKSLAQTYHTRYPGHDELEVDYFRFSTGMGMTAGRFEFGLFPEGHAIFLDSQRYSRALGAALKLSYFPGARQRADLTGYLRDNNYHQDDGRDGLETGIDAAYTWYAGKAIMTPKLYFKQEAADNDVLGYDRFGAGFFLAYPLPCGANAFGGYCFEYDEYQDEDKLFLTTRRDKTHAITLGLANTFKLTERFLLLTGVAYTWETADSSIALYEYDRNVTRIYISLMY